MAAFLRRDGVLGRQREPGALLKDGDYNIMATLKKCGALAALGALGFVSVGHAGPLYLTASGLGMSAGNHGYEIAVTDWLTLTGRSMIGSNFLPNGVDGVLFVASNDAGIGVRGASGEGSFHIAGDPGVGRESLEFNLSKMASTAGMEVGLNRFSFDADEIFVEAWDGDGFSHMVSDQAQLRSAYVQTGTNQGRLDLGRVFKGIDQVDRVAVHATRGNLYIDKFAASIVTDPVPEPASLWLIGSGLIGAIGIGSRRRRRRQG
jgi:hypothetical protein